MMTMHTLKIWPEFFAAVESGDKTFEVRINDRAYKVGDVLFLKEWVMEGHFFTGNHLRRTVTYMITGSVDGIEPGYCVLGFR